jgi:F-type H+-transporting ATPase subunit epsilon
MEPAGMNLTILLPHRVFTEKKGVLRIVGETENGSFGLLPRRLDCLAALVPGILVYETVPEGDVFVAVDEGILVKTGRDVLVTVRKAIGGVDLDRLREAVDREFLTLSEREKIVRSVMDKMETRFIRLFTGGRHE